MCDNQIRKRIIELAEKAEAQRCTVFSDFLNIAELAVFHSISKINFDNLDVALYGGAQDCERQIIRFSHRDIQADPFPVAYIQLKPSHPKFAQEMSHRDVLGALMSLGFERRLIGDIFIREKEGYVICQEHIASYICDSLREIRRTVVSCAVVRELPDGMGVRFSHLMVQAASERIDAVAAKVFGLSRGDSQKLFSARQVLINGRVSENSSYLLKDDDLVSIRGKGRFRFRGFKTTPKRGRRILRWICMGDGLCAWGRLKRGCWIETKKKRTFFAFRDPSGLWSPTRFYSRTAPSLGRCTL